MTSSDGNSANEILRTNKLSCRIEGDTLFLSGIMGVDSSGDFTKTVLKEIPPLNLTSFTINLEELEDIDSAGVITLFYTSRKLSVKGREVKVNFKGGNPNVTRKIEIFGSEKTDDEKKIKSPGFLEQAGNSTYIFLNSYLFGFLLLAANIFYWSIADLFKRKTTRKGEFVNQSVKIGVDAVMIIILMSFAIGLVMAIQSAQYLRDFGADIYIVDLTVIAIMSQMGPLITAILVAGRSGSSIAAEIATMKVTSELDALKTMGLDPVRYVVVPKLYASLFTIPLLIILANVAGISGGATAAYYNLNITPEIFVARMGNVMQNKDLLTAFIKSQVYASIIVLTGSFYGFSVDKGAEGVGKVTTLAVVVSISLVILADSFMAVLFY